MGLFSTTKEIKADEKEYQLENLKRLESDFEPTKALGVKKYPDATQFIYDMERKAFVVVEGPVETFKLKNPYIVDFDQVEDVYLEVEEDWAEKSNKQAPRGLRQRELPAESYDSVFWRYNIYMNIVTSHPYADKIRYRINYDTIVVRVATIRNRTLRGLRLNGVIRGGEIKRHSERIAELAKKQATSTNIKKVDNALKVKDVGDFLGTLKEGHTEDKYIKRMENISKHLERAYRISSLLGRP